MTCLEQLLSFSCLDSSPICTPTRFRTEHIAYLEYLFLPVMRSTCLTQPTRPAQGEACFRYSPKYSEKILWQLQGQVGCVRQVDLITGKNKYLS